MPQQGASAWFRTPSASTGLVLPASHYAVIAATGGFLHDVAAATSEEVTFNEIYADTDGYATTPNHLIIPAGLAGLYLAQFNIRPAAPYGPPTTGNLLITAGTDAFLTLAYWNRDFSNFAEVGAQDFLSWSQFAPFSVGDDLYATFDNETDVTLDYYDTNALASLALYRIDPDFATCEIFKDVDDDVITLSQAYVPGSTSVRSTSTGVSSDPFDVTWTRGVGPQEYDESDPSIGEVTLVGSRADPTGRVVVCYRPA